jgi:site-specific DNA-methyltransferase (adenine-specific)
MPGGVRYYRNTCGKCGATRQDRQLGLESTPEEYVARMVEVFREVRRVLRDDGVLWLNIGDTYNAYNGNRGTDSPYAGDRGVKEPLPPGGSGLHAKGLKQKDLVGIPWRVAFALQADGWYLRCDVIWAKPNPMPESVTDRPTKAHEYVFLMTKAARYFWDARTVAAREVSAGQPGNGTRNLRTVWTIATAPYAGAHFAAFPPEFVRRCIRAGCPYDGVVLDPFMGSGTTGAVAAQMRRRFIGIDLNPEYVEMAKARIRDARAKYLFRAPAQ